MDRPRQALARTSLVVALLALLSVGPGVAACGGDESDSVRERTQRYIESEQEIMRRAEPDFERANEAYLAYTKGELEPETAVEQVEDAERAIRNARDGVLVLDPPPEARRLHDDLVRYLDMNVDFADQTTRLVQYVPAAAIALAPLDRANRRLQGRLADADRSEAQARLLERFAAAVGSIAADLQDLEAPAVLRPVHAEQVRRLDSTMRLARRLERALRARDAERVSILLQRFRTSASEPSARPLLVNQAVAQYNRRLRQLGVAYAEVQQERTRLARALG
jgi:hypothetical protein